MFTSLTKWLSVSLAVLAVTAVMFAMHFRGAAAASADRQHQAESRAAQLDASLRASEAARAKEQAQADKFQAIAKQYEQDKTDAEDRASKLAADLRAERVRLRPEWRCEVPSTPASAGKPDAAADDRSESAARVVRAAADADDQIRALQATLKAERE
jgi:acyl-CoA synthetase (AMP-forming)/AMP-acid ligase II